MRIKGGKIKPHPPHSRGKIMLQQAREASAGDENYPHMCNVIYPTVNGSAESDQYQLQSLSTSGIPNNIYYLKGNYPVIEEAGRSDSASHYYTSVESNAQKDNPHGSDQSLARSDQCESLSWSASATTNNYQNGVHNFTEALPSTLVDNDKLP